ncbi:hypothetical protein DPMN_050188 [Dreissena polymorpha]|uniref:Secreted protein n=1 Tax=Dreissena polymorpha TaxID=45954 RepID=A0A9D4CH21_DREPO|nr:hypothetical protein DPMN_050188 [Dreissena polymorpha]
MRRRIMRLCAVKARLLVSAVFDTRAFHVGVLGHSPGSHIMQPYAWEQLINFKTHTHTHSVEADRSIGLKNVFQPGSNQCTLSVLKKDIANSVDPDETPHNAASHLGLRCLLQ